MVNKDRKFFLYRLIILSYLPNIILPILFLTTGYFVFPEDTLWFIGTWLGLFAFVSIFWQYILGIKPLTKFFTEDFVVINQLHQNFGIYGFILLLAHPAVIFVSYLTQRNENILYFNISTPADIAISLGKIAFGLILVNWLVSYKIRSKFSWRWWKRLHLLNYIILPVTYFHAHEIGTLLQEPLLEKYIQFLTLLFVLLFFYRLGKQFGLFRYKYKLTTRNEITHDVLELGFTPLGSSFIKPAEGQFIEIQTSIKGESHPFTAADYNNESHELFISPKLSGPFSTSLSTLKLGDLVYLDGPYGIFTREAFKDENKKIVLVAGGIGITPFLRLFKYFELHSDIYNEFVIFYGNKTPDDIAYKDRINELTRFDNFKIVHILSNFDGNDSQYVKGFITAELMKSHLKEDLSSYKFFICGPPIMMSKVIPDLKSKGVPSKSIYSERFSW